MKLLDRAAIQFKQEIPLDRENKECVQREFLAENLATFMKGLPAYQRIEGALVTFREFSIASGELTPNLKLRRKPISERYADDLKRLETAIDEARKGRSGGCAITPSIFIDIVTHG